MIYYSGAQNVFHDYIVTYKFKFITAKNMQEMDNGQKSAHEIDQ